MSLAQPGRRAAPRVHPGRLTTHFVLIVALVAWVFPFVWMFATAFRPSAEVLSEPLRLLGGSSTLENFARAWQNANFSRYFLNSVLVTVLSVSLTLLLVAPAGYALGRHSFRGQTLIAGLFGAAMFLPSGYTVIPLFDLVNRLGLNNSLAGVILSMACTGFVLYIFLFAAYFSGLPRELEEAAIMDGANILQIFFRVMLPLSLPVVATVGIFEVIQTWNAFLIPLVLTLTRPDLRVLGVGMYSFFGENSVDVTGLMAAAAISLVPIILVFLFFQRYFVEGVAGAVKS